MPYTLYRKLELVGSLEKDLKDYETGFKFKFLKFKELPGLEELLAHQFTKIDIKDIRQVQKNLILGYRDNDYLRQDLDGTKSLRTAMEELDSNYRGIRGLIPHKKNNSLNQKYRIMGELVKCGYRYEVGGIFAPDNLLTFAIYMFLLAFVTDNYTYITNGNFRPEDIQKFSLLQWLFLPAGAAALVSIPQPLVRNYSRRTAIIQANNIHNIIEVLKREELI